jgi:LPS export ABC transporter protein LptC
LNAAKLKTAKKSGRLKREEDALLIVYREIDQVIKVKATRADLLLEKGNPAIVDFYDGVELDTGDGMKLNTAVARYNTKEATIDAEEEVTIKDKLFEVTGAGFHADLNKQIFEFKKHKITTINKGAK